VAVFAVGAVLAGTVAGLGPQASVASSPREAPLIASDPAADNTDLYAFVSPERPGYVTFIANWIPFEEPNGGPNFYPFATDAAYNVNVDSDGDAKADAVFRWTFKNVDRRGRSTFLYNNGPVTSLDDENLLFRQTYTLQSSFNGEPFRTRVSDAPVAPSRIGAASMPDYQKLRDQATVGLPGGWKLFAGQADDPFFLDLRVFDLLYGGDLSETGQDTLAGYNVNTLAIQVPFKDVALRGDASRNPVIGVWTTTDRNRVRVTGQSNPGLRDDRVQVSRLGNPLVNEVVVPAGLKDTFNSISPDKDAGIPAVVQRVTDPELPKLIQGVYGVPAPKTPRNDLVEIFLTGITTKAGGPIKADLNSQLNNKDVNAKRFRPSEMLRLNLGVPITGSPDRLGVLAGDLQGFPNGRRLTDDTVDIAVQAVEGAAQSGKLVDALAAGDKVDANDNTFGDAFPYVALPNQGAVNGRTGTGGGMALGDRGTAAPSLAPASAEASGDTDTTGVIVVGIVGAAALLTMAAAWGLRRRRSVRGDDTIAF
jgi:MYXO-CTERM domain-containing protein